MERSECESLGTRSIELMRNMRFAPYLVATIYSKRPPCLNFAVYIVSIRSNMLPRRLRRLDALLIICMKNTHLETLTRMLGTLSDVTFRMG